MDDELKSLLTTLMAKVDAVHAKLREFKAEVRVEFKGQGERIARVEGRIEEQSKFLQLALAGRQSRKPAA